MVKNFQLELLAAFNFPIESANSVQTIVPKEDWITLDSEPEFVIINNGTLLHTIQRGDNFIKETIYGIGHTLLSVREKDTLFYRTSVDHKPGSTNYKTLNELLETAEKEEIEMG